MDGPERRSATDHEQVQLVSLIEPLRRILAARVQDPHLVDDVVQETLLRLLSVPHRPPDDALLPYAVVTARNLLTSRGRREATEVRNAPRLLDPTEPPNPEQAVLVLEQSEALQAALVGLPDKDRATLIAHEVHGVDTETLARSSSSTPGAVAAKLARTRARLRVEYLLAVRRVELPTASCKPVLLAVSMGDQRRQNALDAGSHLLTCATCAALSEPLLVRRRGLAAVLPGGVVAWLAARKPPRSSGQSLAQVGAGTAVVTVVVAAVVLGRSDPEPPPPTEARSSCVTNAELEQAARSSNSCAVQDAAVLAVPSDEGFWVAKCDERLWVRLVGSGESRVVVRPGQRLDLRADVARHEPGFARRVGLDAPTAVLDLDRSRTHLRVRAASLGAAAGS